MLNRFARAFFTRLITPLCRLLLRAGVSPDLVTVLGTIGVCAGALIFFPQGMLFTGTMVITAFVFTDLIDGTMARLDGIESRWGAFLDSTLDRIGDAAIFSGLALYFGVHQGDMATAACALACMALGFVVSYSRARAEGLGMTAAVGIAERGERLVVTLVAAGFVGLLNLPDMVMTVVLGLLAVASAITIGQRMYAVYQQSAHERRSAANQG